MARKHGPKVDIPEELADELETPEAAPEEEEESAAAPEGEAGPPEEEGAAEAPQEDIDVLKDKYLRLAAEFENFKRRALKERQDLLNYGNENLIKDLLATVDNLERALGHAREQEEGVDAENLSEGIELTYRSLLQALERAGLQAVEAERAAFDPKVHEAIRQVPTDDCEAGIVLEVFQKGYLLKDRLLRPALVSVSGPAEKETD